MSESNNSNYNNTERRFMTPPPQSPPNVSPSPNESTQNIIKMGEESVTIPRFLPLGRSAEDDDDEDSWFYEQKVFPLEVERRRSTFLSRRSDSYPPPKYFFLEPKFSEKEERSSDDDLFYPISPLDTGMIEQKKKKKKKKGPPPSIPLLSFDEDEEGIESNPSLEIEEEDVIPQKIPDSIITTTTSTSTSRRPTPFIMPKKMNAKIISPRLSSINKGKRPFSSSMDL